MDLRQISKGVKDAGKALDVANLVILYKIELPLALKSILAGVNQTLMLSLSMAVIAALIGAGGLGYTVYVGLGTIRYWASFCWWSWYCFNRNYI